MRRPESTSILAVGALLLAAPSAGAADSANANAQRLDPHASSPAGVIYQIPLDHARRDAAPVPVSGGHGNSGGSAGSGSGVRGAGTSADHGAIHGVSKGAHRVNAGHTEAHTIKADPAYGTPTDPSSIHSENGFGSSSQVPGVSPAALQIGAGVPAQHTSGSALPTYLLIALIAVAATIIGVLAGRAARPRRPRGSSPPGGVV